MLMEIEPGAIRELHWHPNADEWQYVMSGQGKLNIFGSRGRVRTMPYERVWLGLLNKGMVTY